MNRLVVVIAVGIVVIGVIVSRSANWNYDIGTPEEKVLSESVETNIDKNQTSSITDDQQKTVTLAPSPSSTPTDPPDVSVGDMTDSRSGLEKYQYPNSIIVSSTDRQLSLNSDDSPDTITQWYKDTIDDENMNITTFITTNTNGAVMNKLVGANGASSVTIEITDTQNDSPVEIEVTLSN